MSFGSDFLLSMNSEEVDEVNVVGGLVEEELVGEANETEKDINAEQTAMSDDGRASDLEQESAIIARIGNSGYFPLTLKR